MNGTELGGLIAQGLIDGLLQGAKIMLPYIIVFCVICVVIGTIKRLLQKRKK